MPFPRGFGCWVVVISCIGTLASIYLLESSWAKGRQPSAIDSGKHTEQMTSRVCRATFPGLSTENEVSHTVRPIYGNETNLNHGKIIDGRLYIRRWLENGLNTRALATFMAIYRAVLTAPEPIEDVEFVFGQADFPDPNSWALTRQEPMDSVWVVPDYGFYSWPEPKIGSFEEVQRKSESINQNIPWTMKEDVAFFRGAPQGHEQRIQLLEMTANKTSFADIKAIDWQDSSTRIDQWDHCKYRYLVHAEGNTYSGRLKYLLLCDSVILMRPMQWIQHFHPLLIDHGLEQNVVVIQEWQDLERAVEELRTHPQKAQRIMRNMQRVRPYLSMTATNCFWRELFRAYGRKQRAIAWPPMLDDEDVPFESFILMRDTKWDMH